MSKLEDEHIGEAESSFDRFPVTQTDTEKELKIRRSAIKPINERIAQLREESVNAKVKISPERAILVTEFYRGDMAKGASTPVKRALALKYLLEHVSLPIEEGQLIVGIRGTGSKEVPTFPEICCHSLKDLDILDSREKNPYEVDEETKKVYENKIIPFWKEKSMRSTIFEKMSDEWKRSYEAGVFTEFIEQRAPGHTAGGERIFTKGLLDIKEEINMVMRGLNAHEPKMQERMEELKAMEIVADAMVQYAQRYAKKLEKSAKQERNQDRKKELEQMAEISRRVPAHAPRTFWEALQHYWFVHVGIVTESNPWDAFSPGRLDQHLHAFYKKDVDEGTLTRKRAKELLQAFWLKFNNQPAPPKVGVTAQESNTYSDFVKINIGGLKKDGSSGVNEVSYLLLEVMEEMRNVQPNSAVLVSEKTPNDFLERSMEVMRPGFGEPPLFNFEGIIIQLLRQGKSLEDARSGGCSGCVETGAFGKESYILSGYFNLPKVLEITLNNGVDPTTGKKIGKETGDSIKFQSFDELFEAFKTQLKWFIDIKMEGNDIIEGLYAKYLPVPLLSLWINDCVKNAKDYNEGGARYNTHYIQFVGLGTITDSLISIKSNVFNKKLFTIKEILKALRSNYKDYEEMKQIFLNKTAKYGNDDDDADEIARLVCDTCVETVERYPLTPIRGASRRGCFFPTTVHVYFGSTCEATPDGRKARKPISEGISPVQGVDRNGITAVFNSIGKLNHAQTGGTLLNQKLSPELVQGKEIIRKLAQLIRAYFKMGSHHVQFNVVSADLLRKAQKRPQEFQDLMVRVAGYSDYFVNLPKGLQDEIIARTEHNA
jgi:formate C-acetyltransferase